MEFGLYQRKALTTDQVPTQQGDLDDHLVVPLLGMAGEVGSLLVEYKKLLRDGPAHRMFADQVAEELGDVLWYVANFATKCGLDLDDIATRNLTKTKSRWAARKRGYKLLDDKYKSKERFPRRFTVTLKEVVTKRKEVEVRLYVNGVRKGSRLQDNAYDDDGYRFHDVFHVAFVAKLGWSPVLRGLLDRKRRSSRKIDMVEDGGRAAVIDEGVVAFIFEYARKHDYLEGVKNLDFSLLRTVMNLTAGLEVAQRSANEWEEAILAGFDVWREIRDHKGGEIAVDLAARTIEFVRPLRVSGPRAK